MLPPRVRSVLLELEHATHTKGALFAVRGADRPWRMLWSRGNRSLLGARAFAELEGEDWWTGVVHADRAGLRRRLAELVDDRVLEYRVVGTSADQVRWVRESVRRVDDETGAYLVSVVRDVTGEREAERARHQPPIPGEPTVVRGEGPLVLLVEDDTAVRTVLARVLVREGFSTLVASTAAEALRAFERTPRAPDMLVSDVVLPDRSGPRLCEVIRRRAPDLPVLFISGYAAEELLRRGDLPMSAPLLPKPFTPAELAQAIRACLTVRRGSGAVVLGGPESAAC